MAAWRAFGRINAHGMSLETANGIGEIIEGRTDHRVDAVAIRDGGTEKKKTLDTRELAQAWVEHELQ